MHSLVLRHVREYFRTTHASTPWSLSPMSSDTTLIFTTFHPKSNGYFPFFLKNYEPNHDFKLSSNSFKLTFQHMSHLSSSGPFKMVFEHFWDYFHPKFNEWIPLVISGLFSYYIGSHSTLNCTSPWNGSFFNHDQVFRWNSSNYNEETLHQLTSFVLCLHFHDAFATHFSLH